MVETRVRPSNCSKEQREHGYDINDPMFEDWGGHTWDEISNQQLDWCANTRVGKYVISFFDDHPMEESLKKLDEGIKDLKVNKNI